MPEPLPTRSAPRKRGRPEASHRGPDGREILGLSRQAGGRWRISATGERFFEPDERLAIARFERVMAERAGRDTVDLPLPPQPCLDAALTKARATGASRLKIHLRLGEPTQYSVAVGSGAYWATVARDLADPIHVAQMTGIEWVARGASLPMPRPSPKLQSLGDVYAAKPGLSPNEASRSKLFWKEFVKSVGVTTVRELDHDRVVQYEAKIAAADYAPKSILHRYRKVRTIFAYAIKRGTGIEDCRRALDITAMLEVKDHTPLDPRPISVADFKAVRAAAAGDPVFSAMLLVSLNACMYAGEVSALRWDEVDLRSGELVSRRPKTGVSRIAMLWPQTRRSLKALPRINSYCFNTRVRSYTVFSTLDAWRKYRQAAELPEVTVFSQLRDAAYSTALTVSLDQAKLLAGHRLSGAADHYVRRNPSMVAEACAAIRKAYLS